MPSLVVVEDLDVLEARRSRLRTGGEVSVVDSCLLQRGEKTPHRGLAPAIRAAAHAAGDPVLGQEELVHDAHFATRAEARAAIVEYIEVFYNSTRRHSSLGYVSPAEYEQTE